MPAEYVKDQSQNRDSDTSPPHREKALDYLDIALAVVGALALGWIADRLTGGRGVAKTLMASATGALCGWFLAVRVFAVHPLGDPLWLLWAMGGSLTVLLVYFLTRNKR